MTTSELRDKALELPQLPGVYIMMDKTGAVIYVGKAKRLKNRVSSYFRESGHEGKTAALVAKIANFDIIVASSEFEALVLENSLIKQHRPHYNILLKDDKGYPFVRLDLREAYPRFALSSRREDDGARYFGPYAGRSITFSAIDSVCKALRLPTCSRVFPRDIGRDRPCLNHHMGLCDAYCRGEPGEAEYRRAIDEAVMLFDGKSHELCEQLRREMEQLAEELRFELAAEKRDRLKAVEALETKQRMVSGASIDTDVVGFYRSLDKSCFVVLHYMGGQLTDKEFELIDSPFEDDGEAMSQLLRQYYLSRKVYPKCVYLPCETEDTEELSSLFSSAAGQRVYIECPQRGEKRRLVEIANVNAREETERLLDKQEKTLKTLEWLSRALDLPQSPERIEAFDISNTGSSDIVASMTVFKRAKPLKRDYRRFKIKGTEVQNDYASMEEAVTRRFKRYLDGDEHFAPLPELLLIDGGAAHATVALRVLRELGLSVPVFGMVKDDRHRTRALVSPDGREIAITANPPVFALIGTIQEETHRYAIEYHRSLHSRSSYGSSLDRIAGVGEKRRSALLRAFKSVGAIEAASLEELRAVVPRNTAEAVYKFYHETKESEK